MIKISVIIPVYNVEKYLGECLESVLKQTLKEIEVICVNDGSTDSSLQILEEFAENDSRIQIVNKDNSGYGHSLNEGIVRAKGEYISIIESDDFIDKEMLENLYTLAKKDNCDVVKSDWFNYWTKDNTSVKNGKIAPANTGKVLCTKDFKDVLCIQPSVWSAIYKTTFLKENNIKFLNTPGASYQDTSFTFKVFSLAQKIALTDKAYLYYRQDNVNSSIHNKDKVYTICEEYAEIDNFLDSNPSLKTLFINQKLINQYKAYNWTLRRIAPDYRSDFVKKFSESFNLYYRDNKDLIGDFIKKAGKNNLELLLNSPDSYLKKFENKLKKEKFDTFRRNLISVKINSARISVKLFGKQIVKIGK